MINSLTQKKVLFFYKFSFKTKRKNRQIIVSFHHIHETNLLIFLLPNKKQKFFFWKIENQFGKKKLFENDEKNEKIENV